MKDRVATFLLLALGIAIGYALLGMMEDVFTRAAGCVDPLICNPPEAGEFLGSETPERQLPGEIQWAGFRALVAVGFALTLLLLGVVALDLATLLIARSATRRGELALRATLGAAPLTLARRSGGEAARSVVGALVVGVGAGVAGAAALHASWPLGSAPWELVSLGRRSPAIAAAVLMTVVAASLLWPLGVTWSRDLRRFLSIGSRATAGPAETLVRDGLAVIQVAATLVVLVSAGLLVTAFQFSPVQARADAGFRSLVLDLTLPEEEERVVAVPALRAGKYQEIMDVVDLLPGVVDSSVATEGSLVGLGIRERVTALCLECWIGDTPKQQTSGRSRIHAVSAELIESLGPTRLRGRWIGPGDVASAPPVAVISNAFALRLFPNGDPLGKEIRIGDRDGIWVRVIGVVDVVDAHGLASASVPDPAMYLSILQFPPPEAELVVRVTGDAEAAADAIAEAAMRVVPGVRTGAATPLEELLARQRAPLLWFGTLFALLAALVTLVSTGGLHALVAYGVRRRTREIGVRMAIGAHQRQVLRMVIGHTTRLVALGVVIGLIPLSGLARLLQLRFRGVDPWDPALALGAALLLATVGLVASYLPARRASRLDPQVALRES